MSTTTDPVRRLNHVEMVYRPGERELAGRVFEVLGLRVLDRGGTWFSALVDPDVADFSNNAGYASEVTPEQWALEQSLADAIADDNDEVGGSARGYLERLRTEPQRSFHVCVCDCQNTFRSVLNGAPFARSRTHRRGKLFQSGSRSFFVEIKFATE